MIVVIYFAAQLVVSRRYDMFDLQYIKLAGERNKKAVELKPSLNRGTETARARLTEDLRFDIDIDGIKISADVPQKYGGNGNTPGSSAHALSSIICCTMVGYLMKFAERNIPIEGIDVEVQADWDKDISNGYTGLRYTVSVESSAPEEDIRRAIEDNNETSFGLAIIQQPVDAHCEVRISKPAA